MPGLFARSLSLSLSLSTTSHEAVKLIITKLGLSSDKRDYEKYRLLAISLNGKYIFINIRLLLCDFFFLSRRGEDDRR